MSLSVSRKRSSSVLAWAIIDLRWLFSGNFLSIPQSVALQSVPSTTSSHPIDSVSQKRHCHNCHKWTGGDGQPSVCDRPLRPATPVIAGDHGQLSRGCHLAPLGEPRLSPSSSSST